jgi:pimeloyl-ACP methyl ester carboxylesterase
VSRTPVRRRLVLSYLPLLAVSALYRARRKPGAPGPGVLMADLPDGENPVRMAYRDSAPERRGGPPLVLVHGSPGSGEVFDRMGRLLAPRIRVLAPDLPGFGDSARRIPDYSFLAHARYLLRWLDAIGIQRAHLGGFSMGGGVVLSAAALAPDRVESLLLLSAIGVQEHELTGSYWWNHLLHAGQLAVIGALDLGIPHFGLFDRFPLGLSYARNFYDSDQRPLRGILESWGGPMLILHGNRDSNVPAAAAREHHRIVRRSRLVVYPGDHFLVFQRPELMTPEIVAFLEAVARGKV